MSPTFSSAAAVPATACRAASSRAHVPTLIDFSISRTAMLCITHVAHFRQYEASRCQVSLHFEPSSAQWCCRSERHRCAGAAASELQADGSRVTAARQRPKVYSLVTRGGGQNAPKLKRGGVLCFIWPKKMGRRPDAIPVKKTKTPPPEAERDIKSAILGPFWGPYQAPLGGQTPGRTPISSSNAPDPRIARKPGIDCVFEKGCHTNLVSLKGYVDSRLPLCS